MWQERKPLRSPVGSTLQRPLSACAQLFIPPALKHSRMMSGDPVDRTWKQRHNVRGFLKWPQTYLSACLWPTPTPPPPEMECCSLWASVVMQLGCIELITLLSSCSLSRLPCGHLTDRLSQAPRGYGHVFLVTGLQSRHICLYLPDFEGWILA